MYLNGAGKMRQLEVRREFTEERFSKLKSSLREASDLVDDKACVYVTGSFGRVEASEHSDLDLFIVSEVEGKARKLSHLDEILIKADLIKAADRHKLPPFSGDGKYLTSHSVIDLIDRLGEPNDDSENTLTARLLLLLESRPLIGDEVHKRVIEAVIAAYWKDYSNHPDGFMPAFLTNDILRLWRTFCLNYEADLRKRTPEHKAKGKLKNYKLRHSRMLTCFSAILYLLFIFSRHGSVTGEDAVEMALKSPSARLLWVRQKSDDPRVVRAIEDLLNQYNSFLEVTNYDEEALLREIEDDRSFLEDSMTFGDKVFEIARLLGQKKAWPFYRLLMV
jgi:predicted nucleotidyltransferase